MFNKKQVVLETMPLTVNRLYGGRRYLTNEGRACKEAIALEAMVQWRSSSVQSGLLRATVDIFFKDARRQDTDNVLKCLLDALTGVCYADDSQVKQILVTQYVDRHAPRVELTLSEYVEQRPVPIVREQQ